MNISFSGAHWAYGKPITWALNRKEIGRDSAWRPLTTEIKDGSIGEELILRAIAVWEAVANVEFAKVKETVGINKQDISFGFMAIDENYHGSANIFYNYDARTRLMLPGTSIMIDDPNYDPIKKDQTGEWRYADNSVSLFHVVLQQIGYALGLGTSKNPEDVMSNAIGASNDIVLSGNDITFVQSLYGLPKPIQITNRLPHDFDVGSYVASYPDLISAFGKDFEAAADHYIKNGQAEGRVISFDGISYVASYSDLIVAFGSDEQASIHHYITRGHVEGRSVSFDGWSYIASYPDLIAAFGTNKEAATHHYVENGYAEGRKIIFDELLYIASNPDLVVPYRSNEGAAAIHYITRGLNEGLAMDGFDALQYLENYSDLSAAFGTNQEAAIRHFITYGYYEGRTDNLIS